MTDERIAMRFEPKKGLVARIHQKKSDEKWVTVESFGYDANPFNEPYAIALRNGFKEIK